MFELCGSLTGQMVQSCAYLFEQPNTCATREVKFRQSNVWQAKLHPFSLECKPRRAKQYVRLIADFYLTGVRFPFDRMERCPNKVTEKEAPIQRSVADYASTTCNNVRHPTLSTLTLDIHTLSGMRVNCRAAKLIVQIRGTWLYGIQWS